MFKKVIIAAAVVAMSSGVAFANNAYVGASVGVKTNTSDHVNARTLPLNLAVGFGGLVGNGMYVAGEVYGSPASANIANNGLKTATSYGFSVIPGVMISDHTMGYARLGVVRTRFTPSGVSNKTVTGGQAGLGLQTNLMQNWDVRGEYTYTAYNSVTNVSGHPRSDEFGLGLVYKFE